MKFLLLFLVLAIAYVAWRNARIRDRAERAAPAPPRAPSLPQDMVDCPVCGVHLPRDEALAGPSGRLYCSADHRRLGGN